VTAFVATSVGLVLWANAWAVIVRAEPGRRALRQGFYLSQLGKYVPGGIWQAAGMVSLARDAGVQTGSASAAFGAFAVTQVVGAATVGGVLAIAAPDLPNVARFMMIAGLALVALLYRRWMVVALRQAARVVKRIDRATIPPQHAIVHAYAWCIGATICTAVSFVAIAHPPTTAAALAAGAAFATAWWIGFIAVPFPSGIGIREVVLIGLLNSIMSSGAVVTAAVGQRLASIAAELLLIGLTTGRRLQRGRSETTHIEGRQDT
jgi:hypothetical protein